MVNHTCCVVGCTADKRKNKHLDKYPWMRGVHFRKFPVRKVDRDRWIKLVRRDKDRNSKNEKKAWEPSKHSRVCSRHFDGVNPDPTLFPYNNYKVSEGRRSSVAHLEKRRQREEKVSLGDVSDSIPVPLPLRHLSGDHSAEIPAKWMSMAEQQDPITVPEMGEVVQIPEEPKTATDIHQKPVWQSQGLDHSYVCAEQRVQSTLPNEVGCQTDMTTDVIRALEDEVFLLKAEVRKQKEELKKQKEEQPDKCRLMRELFVDEIMKDPEYFCGVRDTGILQGLFCIMMQVTTLLAYWDPRKMRNCRPAARILTMWQEYLLTLVWLRHGLQNRLLGTLFGVSQATVTRVYTTWLNFLYQVLKPTLIWPSQELVRENTPPCFAKYPNTRCIIDATEIFINRPRNPTIAAQTYSHYKSHNTWKVLVGITPAGAFSFMSQAYSGSISDRSLTSQCGFLDNVEEGDHIMADRGFLIRDLLLKKGARLNIPPFTKAVRGGKGRRLTVRGRKETKKIAAVRIHVERAIRRLKVFRIFSGFLDSSKKDLIDQALVVVAALCNLKGPLF